MDQPQKAGSGPILIDMNAGETRYWCACGKSASQPFCDGSHKGTTDIIPLLFTVEESGKKALCNCKQTKTPPYCDGSHLTADQIIP
ncbi:CDGSH iron-sulfur domain-containing protein [Proteiniclasticum sp.]|uniref:CDGSH iron-sulfur domain-containing protein n=1 Tax=Proteiniclasticum sp. TaxID=2053595 RepID=UPI002896F82C|nr:CDGSH iron-sulfur domain-containing protein [Proteiniclasticum sp.]